MLMLQSVLRFAERRPAAPLLAILLVGMLARVWMLPVAGFALDLEQHYYWGLCTPQYGLFGMYLCSPDITHPPISPILLGAGMSFLQMIGADVSYFDGNAPVIFILKLPNLLFEIAIVCIVYYLVWKRAGVRWAAGVTAALNWNPGWVVVTSFWGQNDPSYSFFLLLAALALVRHRPRWLWLAYGVAWLAKFQSIMFLPVIVVFTFRRHGWRAVIEGLVIWIGVVVAGVVPFYLGSGEMALNPYIGTVNLFPYITTGAFNMWFWISGSSRIAVLDSTLFIGGITYFQAGLLLLILGTALICLRVWLLPERDDEWVVLVAANLSFFMLATQMQIRYIFPGLIFLAIAMARDWRLIVIYTGISIAFTYNVFDVVELSIGLLYYPAKLMAWSPTVNALMMTVFYIAFMAYFLRPLWAVRAEIWQRAFQPVQQ